MFKPISHTRIIQSPAQTSGNAAPNRLLVLAPNGDVDLIPMAQRVWELAEAGGSQVSFLSLYSDPSQEAGLKRKLITLSAMLQEGGIRAQAEVARGTDWVDAVRSRWQPGDMLVCPAEQSSGLLQKPLSQILRSNLDAPVTILSGLETALDVAPKWGRRAAWAGLIGIVLFFSLLQAGILLRVQEGIGVWMLVSIAAEYWLISIYNRRFG